jgi:hypothetical protein
LNDTLLAQRELEVTDMDTIKPRQQAAQFDHNA